MEELVQTGELQEYIDDWKPYLEIPTPEGISEQEYVRFVYNN